MNISRRWVFKVYWISVLGFYLFGCQSLANSQKEEKFLKLFPSVQMNQQLELQTPLGELGERPKYRIGLILKNNSSDQIILPDGLDYMVFFYSDQVGWEKITNLYSRKGREEIIDPKGGEFWRNIAHVYIMLDPKEIENIDKIRVAVLGSIYRDGKATDKQVGAFLDVKLSDFIK